VASSISIPLEESRFLRLLPEGRDLTLIILKGHLLVEEELNSFLSRCPIHPTALEDARLTFLQKLRVVRAFYPLRQNAPEWGLAEELNKLRNKIAHHAEVSDLHSLVDRLVAAAKRKRSRPAAAGVTRAEKLRHVIIYLAAFFTVVTETMLDMQAIPVKDFKDLIRR
jgi:hypothetical protein